MGVAHLAPHEHVPEHDLQPVEEVVAYDNDGGAARGPALPGANGLNAGGGSWGQEKSQVRRWCQVGDGEWGLGRGS